MCDECKQNKQRLEEHGNKDVVEVGTTKTGFTIFRVPNKDIGGYDYISDSVGGGWCPVNALCSIEELELIIADMKLVEESNNE